jgi:hypothetical protein
MFLYRKKEKHFLLGRINENTNKIINSQEQKTIRVGASRSNSSTSENTNKNATTKKLKAQLEVVLLVKISTT